MPPLPPSLHKGNFINAWDLVDMPGKPNESHPNPRIFGQSGKLIKAEFAVPPPNYAPQHEEIPWFTVIKISPKPDPKLWESFFIMMSIKGIGRESHDDKQPEREGQKPPMTFGGQELKGDPDALYVLFDKVAFPEQCMFTTEFSIYVTLKEGAEVPAEDWIGGVKKIVEPKLESHPAGTLEAVGYTEVREGGKRTRPLTEEQQMIIDRLLASKSTNATA